jgi:serine/threonine protein kinase
MNLGRYQILRQLGEGGMGRVYLGEAAAPGGFVRRVVIKVVRDPGDAALRESLVAEARVAAMLVHRNIVPVLDLDEVNGERLMILEHIDGIDLRRLIDHKGALPPALAAFIAAEVAAALDYAHRRCDAAGRPLGLVHRDVSPGNVLVSWEGEVKLTDFGVASVSRDAGGVRGNPGYMAPEQARGEPVDARADLFSLGVTLWEMAAGRVAFPDDDVARARERALPLFDGALAPIVARATAAEPGARFESAAALRDALLRLPSQPRDPARDLAAWLVDARPAAKLAEAQLREAALGSGRPLTAVVRPAPLAAHRPSRAWVAVAALLGLALVGFVALRLSRARPATPTAPTTIVVDPAVTPKKEEPRLGTLSVNALPWARISVDGRAYGQTPRSSLALRPGAHTLRLITAGGDERTRTVHITAGRETRITVDFAQP